MSNKILIFSDLHIHRHKNRIERLSDCLEVFNWVFKVAQEHKVDDILFLGDLFHDRRKIDIFTYHKTFLVLEEMLNKFDIPVTFLLGNHDIWHKDKWDVNSIAPLRSLKGVKVVESPGLVRLEGCQRLVAMMPYTIDPIEHLKEIKVPDTGLLFAHLALDGASLNANSNFTSKAITEFDGDMIPVNSSIFTNWKRVFLGHYHFAQKITKNIEYVGSPLQLDFGEAFQEKHIVIHDIDKNEDQYILNNFSPKHYIINFEDIEKYNLKNNFIEIKVKNILESKKIDLSLSLKDDQEGPKYFTFVEDISEDSFSLEGIELNNIKSVLSTPFELASKWVELQIENGTIEEERKPHLLAMWDNIEKEKMENSP